MKWWICGLIALQLVTGPVYGQAQKGSEMSGEQMGFSVKMGDVWCQGAGDRVTQRIYGSNINSEAERPDVDNQVGIENEMIGDSLAQDVFKRINEERAAKGLVALKPDASLTHVAIEHSKDMVANNYFAHISPITEEGFAERFKRGGVTGYSLISENIAMMQGDVSAQKAVEMWMNSEGHRKNILSSVTHTGIGIAKAANGAVYITQTFARY